MDDCRHGFPEEQCATCLGTDARGSRSSSDGSTAGKRFALVYAPTVRPDTFIHLNREGERWKLRHYADPHRPAEVLAQSAPSALSGIELASLAIEQEIAFPYSTSPGGVSVEDTRYWHDAIMRMNAQFADRVPALRQRA